MRATQLAIVWIGAILAEGAVGAEPPPINKPAPPFSLRDREGALVSLSDLAYPGQEKASRPRKVVLLDFFRTDCQPCRKALPRLVELQKKLGAKPVKIIVVALLEEEEGQEKLDRFLQETKLPLLVLVDPYGSAAKKYVSHKGGLQIPALFLVDRTGVLRRRLQGAEAESVPKLATQLEELLR